MITLANLKAGYKGTTVLDIPSLTIAQGQKFLLKGASGSGKTTLLYALAGIGEIQSGTVTVNGTNLYELAESERDKFRGHHIGIVFQTLHLVKSLTVRENVLLAASINNTAPDMAYINELLTQTDIADIADKPATQISQGQAQRAAIVRAMVMKPALLLADEPTSGLDDRAAANVMNLLKHIVTTHKTTLVVASHDNRITADFDFVYNVEGK